MRKPKRRPIVWVLLLAAACNHAREHTEPDSASALVAYEQRGSLYTVNSDGSGHTLVRKKQRRPSVADEPDVKLYDLWLSPVVRPGSGAIAVVRARNRSFNVYPNDPTVFDQRWDLVLVDPAKPENDRMLFTSQRHLDELRWSDDGKQLLGRIGRGELLVWRNGRCETRALEIPGDEPEDRKLLFADFTRDGKGVIVLMNNYLEVPYLVGTAPLREGALQVTRSFTFPGRHVPDVHRQDAPVVRLLGRGSQGTALRPPFFVTPDRRYSFYHRKREGFFPRGWIERVDGVTGEAVEVHTTWRGLFAK